jgi:hypothetical protein
VQPATTAITAAYANRMMRDAINMIRQDDRVRPLLKEMWMERATVWNMQRAFVAIEFDNQFKLLSQMLCRSTHRNLALGF